jgi:PAS domain S-box-containing protein
VLILDDLGYISSPGFAEVDQAIFAGLQKSPYRIELYHESLEVTLFPDQLSQLQFRKEFARKYSSRKPDVIIVAGSESFKFITESHESFLRDIPIIFCVILKVPEGLNRDLHFTGVLGRLHPEETLRTALRLLPQTKHVAVVGGRGKFDEDFEAIAKQAFQNYESKLEFTYLTDLAMPALLERLKHLPSNTIVYHTAITEDAAGERFIDSAQSIPLVSGATNAPVFVMDDVNLRDGTIGGYLVNWADDSRIAGEMAVRVLNGEKPEDIPVAMSNDAYMFDWRSLKRWHLDEAGLPPGSIVLNKPPNIWEAYKRYFIAGIFLLLLQAAVIAGLLWQRTRRKRTEAELRESERRFRLVANTAPVMIWMSGPDKLCTYFNAPWLKFTGRTLEEESGNGWARGVHPDDLQKCWETYSKSFDQREPFQMEYRLRRSDGEYRWVFDQGVPRFNADASLFGYIGSCIDVTERKAAEETLSNIGRKLIEAHEEERSWIARELHDDFNQRITLLAVNLVGFKKDLFPRNVQLSLVLEETIEQVKELGRDMQALAHRLHSSKLEYLGVVAACAGFCRELSEGHQIEVEFRSEDIPKKLPQEISLCLFRILQEALQNAVRHSGVQHFQVSLIGGSNEIRLTIRDSGIGFDPAEAIKGSGLGLVSMKERIKLVDGELLLDSQLQRGTTIQARVPLAAKAMAAKVGV